MAKHIEPKKPRNEWAILGMQALLLTLAAGAFVIIAGRLGIEMPRPVESSETTNTEL